MILALSRLAALALAALAGTLAAQDDLRDRLHLRNGKSLAGRVLTPAAQEEVLLVQGGKRLRIARAEIERQELVADAVAEFLTKRRSMRGSARAQWYLVEWANGHGLPGLARAQAMSIVLADDNHQAAHEWLGHEHGAKGWLWEHRGKKFTRERLDEQLSKQPFVLAGERFVVHFHTSLREGIDALFDLEALGVAWLQQFGTSLQLQEVLRPIDVDIARNVDAFQKWGFRPVPYLQPPNHGDVARTFCTQSPPSRPERLFFVGTHGLLYRTLIGSPDRADREGVCAWLEVGLSSWMQARMQGAAGMAEFAPPLGENLIALQALAQTPRLAILTLQPLYGGFYLADDAATAANWATAHMLVAWLKDGIQPESQRAAFLRYVHGALAEGKGGSSSYFDSSFGLRIEDLEPAWREWVGARSRD